MKVYIVMGGRSMKDIYQDEQKANEKADELNHTKMNTTFHYVKEFEVK